MIQYLNGDIVSGNTCIVSETVPVGAGAVFLIHLIIYNVHITNHNNVNVHATNLQREYGAV
ncbi:hypothetical protein K150096H7_38090 [[Clostridium] symbiosum]